MKSKIKIITDTGCDLEPKWLEQNVIHIIKFGLIINDEEYEGETNRQLSVSEFYEKMSNGAMPKTTQINPYTAKQHIEPFLIEGYDILYISFSSGLSGSFNSVNLASLELKEEYPNRKIYILDSLCASLGQGLLLDYVVKKMNKGCSFEELVEYAENLKLKINHKFTVSNLFHLKRGGRVSSTTAVVGSLLSIKPILHVNNHGKLVSINKKRGRLASLKCLFEMFINSNDVEDNDPIFISHADCYDDATKLANMIRQFKPNNEIYINYIGPIIGTHAGQGTVALFYKGKGRE